MGQKLDAMKAAARQGPTQTVAAGSVVTTGAAPPKAEKKKKANPPFAERKDAQANKRDRLPDGSTFNLTWLAGRQTWVGKMSVPTGAEAAEFTATHTGAFGLMQKLDDMFRAWLAARQTPA